MKKFFIYFFCLFLFLKFLEKGMEYSDNAAQRDVRNEYGLIEMSQGSLDAPRTVIVYYSLACYYSRKFLQEVYPELLKKYVNTGQLKLIFREFYIPSGTEWSVKLSRIAGSKEYVAFINYAIANKTFENSSKPSITLVDLVLPFFSARGFNKDDVEKCLKSEDIMSKVRNAANDATVKYKINGAPSFVYKNKVHVGLPSIQDFDRLVESGKFGNQ